LNAAWFIHGKTLRREIRFWLAITGYDLNDRSSSNRIYLLYLVLFFSVWGLSLMALITSGVAQFLTGLSPLHPFQGAVQLAVIAILLWWVWMLYRSSRNSPIHFTAEDAVLICATPISRRAVTFTWLLGEWFTSALPFWGLAIMLGFIRSEISILINAKPGWSDAPLYLRNGLSFLLPVLVFHVGMYSLAWTLGCFRLRGARELRYPLLAPLAVALILAPGLLMGGQGVAQVLSLPLMLPVAAGAGISSYWVGSLVSVVWAMAGLGGLYWASQGLNLARAAQESTASPSVGFAVSQQAATARLKRRLKGGSGPSRIPVGRGPWALVWKQTIRQVRAFGLETVWDWLLVLLLSLGIWMAPDWGSRGVGLFFWALRVHALTSQELRTDLGLWFPAQPLPLKANNRLMMELIPSAVVVTLFGWLGAGVASLTGLRAMPLELALLVPFIALTLAFSAGYDVLRQTKAEHLMIGSVPTTGIVSTIVSGLVISLSGFLFSFFRGNPFGLFLAMVLCVLFAYGLLAFAVDSYKELGQ
jgi:hypothetical protein